MNSGQEKFLTFISERVRESEKESALELLKANFEKQDNGTFTKEDMMTTQSKLMEMLRPEAVEEVKIAMMHFGSKMK